MKIKKFIGKSEEEATKKAKQELGNNAVIMNVKEIKPTGFFKVFKSSSYEITAAVEESEYRYNLTEANNISNNKPGRINLSASEEIDINNIKTVDNSGTYAKPTVSKERFMKENDQIDVVKSLNNVNFDAVKDLIGQKSNEVVDDSNKRVINDESKENIDNNSFEKRLENIQNILQDRYQTNENTEDERFKDAQNDESLKMIKMIYNTLLDNEVDERFANQLLEEMDKSLSHSSSIDMMLANVYQKIILKFGQPSPIEITPKKPNVVFFIGPTGVGKTTTIAKIASKLKMDAGKKIALFTADTYRIAAEEQLRTYANILDTPLTIIYSADDLKNAISMVKDVDVVLVDTAGFSHKSENQKNDTKTLIDSLPSEYSKEVYLVLSATTKYRDLKEIADSYKNISSYKLIFTKLDETTCYGNLYNIRMYTGSDMSYVTYGQNVPEDISVFNTQLVVKKLLGGK